MTVQSLFPLSVLCTGGLFLASFLPYFPVSLLLLLGGLLLLLFAVHHAPFLPALILTGSVVAGGFLLAPDQNSTSLSPTRHVEFCIDSQPSISKNGMWVSGRDEGEAAVRPTRIRLFVPSSRLRGSPLAMGDCLSGTATYLHAQPKGFLFLPPSPSLILTSSDLLTRVPGSSVIDRFLHFSAELEQRLSEQLKRLFPEDTAGLLAALVLSDTRFLSPKEQEDFRRAGVSHLLSVSGEHMTLLALFLGGTFLLLLKILPLPVLRRLSVHLPLSPIVLVSTLPFLGFYTVMIGAPPAAGRAFLGFSLVSVMNLLFIDLSFEEILGLSTIIMLCLVPSLARSLSFLLSLLALWSLVVVQRLPGGSRKRQGVRELFRQSFLAGLVIIFVSTPLLGLLFKTANPAGIISNPLLIPLAGDLLLPVGFTDLAILLSGDLPEPLWVATNALSHGVLGLAAGFSAIPASEIPLLPLNPGCVFLFYGVFMLSLVLPFQSWRGPLCGLLLLFGVTLASPHSPSATFYKALSLEQTEPGFFSYHPRVEKQNICALFR